MNESTTTPATEKVATTAFAEVPGSGLWEALEDMARQHCFTKRVERDYNGQVAGANVTDSGGLSADAEALRQLDAANPRRFRIVAEYGRMVVGYWPENDPNTELRNAPQSE